MLVKSIRIARGYMLLYCFLLQCGKKRFNYALHQYVLILLEASLNSVECEAVFWYFIGKGYLGFEFVHRATTSFFEIGSFEGCGLSFVFMSNIFPVTLGQSLKVKQ